MDIFRHRPICGLFPLKCQSLRQTFQRIIQTLFFLKHLHRFCWWFYFNETKFQNKSRKFFLSLPSIFGYLGIETILFHTHWVILFESTLVKTWFAPLFNQSEKRNDFFTCELNVSTNHSAPTKSNCVFGSFRFILAALSKSYNQNV